MENIKVTFIATVLNEQSSIEKFLKSIEAQSRTPNEIVIVDGGSKDRTYEIIKNFSKNKPNFKVLIKKGNRSSGRNIAVKMSSHEIIVCSDAGCILDRTWLENIISPFSDQSIEVVSGYYKGISSNIFQKSLIPYVLVMEDKIKPNIFLPSSRSMAFRKSIVNKLGGFNEELSDNEDYAFAKKLKINGVKTKFVKNAVVYWVPRKNIKEAFHMFYRFAKGDAKAKILRPKVVFILLRYILGIVGLVYAIFLQHYLFFLALLSIVILYLIWSIFKNYKYVNDIRAFYYLPLLQITSDMAVILGTLKGMRA